jgi:hypothetical protein
VLYCIKCLSKILTIVTGFLNRLPVPIANCAEVKKFLVCVKGPNIVFEICVSPLGINTNVDKQLILLNYQIIFFLETVMHQQKVQM